MLRLKIIISIFAAVAIGAKLYWPDLEVDAVVLGLIVIGVLPWLSPLIKAVELPGGLKVELQEIKDAVDEAKGTAESARRRAELAENQAVEATRPAVNVSRPDWSASVEALVNSYNAIREEMSSSWERTEKMTEVVRQMANMSRQHPEWDIHAHLRHANRGWRLMAYAFAYACPKFELLESLTSSACDFIDDNKPFGQYWSILAIQRVMGERVARGIPMVVWGQLDRFYRWLTPGTDRHDEMRRLMESINKSPKE